MRKTRWKSKTTAYGLEREVCQDFGGGVALTLGPGHDELGCTINPCHNQIIAAAGLRQRANEVHTPVSERLQRYTRERVNPQPQSRRAFSGRTRTATTNKMSHVSEHVRPPKKLRNISRRTSDTRVSRKSITMCRMQHEPRLGTC